MNSEKCPHEKNKTEENENSLVIYWAIFSQERSWAASRLIQKPPKWLQKDFLDLKNSGSRPETYLQCPAHTSVKKDTLVFECPFDFDFSIDENKNVVYGNSVSKDKQNYIYPTVFDKEEINDKNRIAFSLNWRIILFSEESVEAELFPPYLHNSLTTKHGALSSGKFDIGKWFRPISADYILWNNNREFAGKINEPWCYVRLNTNKKIILKEFKSNDLLQSIGSACTTSIHYDAKKTLQDRYDSFNESLRSVTLQEIKKNLL